MIGTLIFWLCQLALIAEPFQAEVVIHSGKIWTGNPDQAEVQALAIWQGKILGLGTTEHMQKYIGVKTQVVDLKGQRVVPGFYDSHIHFLGGGLQLSRVELKDCANEAEFGKRLREFDEKLPRDRWMLGGNWDHDRAFGGILPTAATIDKYVKNRPVFIRRYDGHMALANTVALKMANITADTKDPAGGVIERLADGKTPSGALKDNAMSLLDRIIPEPNNEEIIEAVRASLRTLAENGITSVQDMEGSSPETRRLLFRILQRLDTEDQLTCRIDLRWPIEGQKDITMAGLEKNFGTPYLRVGGVKGFMDGSLGSSTAKMFEPYEGTQTNTGVFVTEPEKMLALARQADRDGLSIAIHAIGDQANASLLDIFGEVQRLQKGRGVRFRIEHVQHLRPQDYPRFKELGVIASMQPFHVADDGRWAEGRIGKKRCQSSYAFRSLLDAGATLAFGSDWPVAPLNVLQGMDAAVNRRTLDDGHPNGWFPEQRITVAEALRAYTLGSATAGNQDRERGTLEVGKVADFVVLNRDVLDAKIQPEIGKIQIQQTYIGGKKVYDNEGN